MNIYSARQIFQTDTKQKLQFSHLFDSLNSFIHLSVLENQILLVSTSRNVRIQVTNTLSSLGNRFHRYIQQSFPWQRDKYLATVNSHNNPARKLHDTRSRIECFAFIRSWISKKEGRRDWIINYHRARLFEGDNDLSIDIAGRIIARGACRERRTCCWASGDGRAYANENKINCNQLGGVQRFAKAAACDSVPRVNLLDLVSLRTLSPRIVSSAGGDVLHTN